MKNFDTLQMELRGLQHSVIALAKIYGKITLVVEVDEESDTFKTVDLGVLGGFAENYMPLKEHKDSIVYFPPKYENLLEFLEEDPVEFANWYLENFE